MAGLNISCGSPAVKVALCQAIRIVEQRALACNMGHGILFFVMSCLPNTGSGPGVRLADGSAPSCRSSVTVTQLSLCLPPLV